MSTEPPPLDDLDLSAVLDGEATDEVRARLADDVEAQARLEALRAARDSLAAAQVEPLTDDVVDDLVTIALDRGAEAPVDPGDPIDDAVVAPLAARHRRQIPPWLVAAVVVVLVGLGLTLVWTGRDDGAEMTFETVGSSISADDRTLDDAAREGAPGASSSAGLDGGATDQSDQAEAAAPSSTVDGTVVDRLPLVELGAFTDADALRVALRDGFPTTPVADEGPATDDALTAAARCLGKVDDLFGTTGDPVAVGVAVVDGSDVAVLELPFRTDDGRATSLVLAVDQRSCIPLLSFQR
jgi:hypothetical protein